MKKSSLAKSFIFKYISMISENCIKQKAAKNATILWGTSLNVWGCVCVLFCAGTRKGH